MPLSGLSGKAKARFGRVKEQFPRRALFAGAGAALAIALLLTIASRQIGIIDALEHWTADWRTALLSQTVTRQHPDLAVVLIDEETLERFGAETRAPTDRALLAALVTVIDGAKPRAVGLDVIFDLKTGKDGPLLDALRGAKSRVVLGSAEPPIKLTPKQTAFQAAFLKETGLPFGYLNVATEFDEVVRVQGEPDADPKTGQKVPYSFAEALATAAGKSTLHEPRRLSWLKGRAGAETFLAIPAFFLLPGLNEREDLRLRELARLKDRVVIIGVNLYGSEDTHKTPLSKLSRESMPGVFLQAQAVAQILDGRGERDLPVLLRAVLASLVAFAGFLVGYGGFHKGWLRAVAPILVYLAADVIAFTQLAIILPFAIAAMAWLLGAAAGSILRRLGRPGTVLTQQQKG